MAVWRGGGVPHLRVGHERVQVVAGLVLGVGAGDEQVEVAREQRLHDAGQALTVHTASVDALLPGELDLAHSTRHVCVCECLTLVMHMPRVPDTCDAHTPSTARMHGARSVP